MKQVDCVVFDIGNVLVRWEPQRCYRLLGYTDAETAAIIAETGLMEINHRVLDAGGSFEEATSGLAERFPDHASFVRAWHTHWAEMLDGAIEPNVQIIAELKQAGIPVHAISNFNDEKFEIACTYYPFLNSFDGRIISGYEGVVKPDREIFELYLDRHQQTASRAVFVDDSSANIAVAQELGFQTVHYRESGVDLRAELVKLGVLPERTDQQ